mmetsp:Transcript_37593/g.78738  ORF Transcript_37593/g.78738 Transcript_37593/m.78738 type:complete len:434 (+) Transcript_37593:218-1519(+)
MLWTVQHRVAKLSCFAFNCYRHEIRLVCWRPEIEALILLSKGGVKQGDPLAMALYGIALLPLGEFLQTKSPDVLQPWYADGVAMQGKRQDVADTFWELIRLSLMFGYLPEPEKSFAICHLATEATAKTIFEALGLPVRYRCGHRHVGGFVGSAAMKNRWIKPMVSKWVQGVEALAKVARKYSQSAFYGFSQSLQAEWQYVCRCVEGVEEHLQPVEEAIQGKLIPVLLECEELDIANNVWQLLSHGTKQGGMNLRDPLAGAVHLYQVLTEASAVLGASLLADTPLDSVAHKACVREAGTKARKEKAAKEKAQVDAMKETASKAVTKRLERIGETGLWMTLPPCRIDGTTLSQEEWQDNARLRYGMRLTGLCSYCDGCGGGFTVEYALGCKKGGLMCMQHDDVRDEAGALAAMALTKSKVTYEPTFFCGRGIAAT